jgi:hypothetical protein
VKREEKVSWYCAEERKRKEVVKKIIIKIFDYVFPTGLCWLAINTIRKTKHHKQQQRREEEFSTRVKIFREKKKK